MKNSIKQIRRKSQRLERGKILNINSNNNNLENNNSQNSDFGRESLLKPIVLEEDERETFDALIDELQMIRKKKSFSIVDNSNDNNNRNKNNNNNNNNNNNSSNSNKKRKKSSDRSLSPSTSPFHKADKILNELFELSEVGTYFIVLTQASLIPLVQLMSKKQR